MGGTRVADESRVVESEPNDAGFEGRRAGRTGCPENGPLLALRSRHFVAADPNRKIRCQAVSRLQTGTIENHKDAASRAQM